VGGDIVDVVVVVPGQYEAQLLPLRALYAQPLLPVVPRLLQHRPWRCLVLTALTVEAAGAAEAGGALAGRPRVLQTEGGSFAASLSHLGARRVTKMGNKNNNNKNNNAPEE
jgi:hypothetical protein